MPNQFSGLGSIYICNICHYKARLAYALEHLIKKHNFEFSIKQMGNILDRFMTPVPHSSIGNRR